MKSEWITALAESLEEKAEKVPTGWKRQQQIAKELKRSARTTRDIVQGLIDSGKAEVANFSVQTKSGIRPTPHFRIRPE